ncbi:MAG: hypothetical protein BYD32DRAFT_459151 [Podila humilis]|nr:MAG: hypothetical protein BYD32DRAFT_459151 [Podila humilis]
MCTGLEELLIQGSYFHSVTILDSRSSATEDHQEIPCSTAFEWSHTQDNEYVDIFIARATIPPCTLERLIVACPGLRILKARSINKANWFDTEDPKLLELFPNPLDPFDSARPNNILCQMPNLIHLDGSLASLDEQVNDFAQLQAAIFQVGFPPRPHLNSKCFKSLESCDFSTFLSARFLNL